MKDIGLTGLPYSGKSTLFTALTRVGAAGGRSSQAVVPVPDPRLAVLAELERSRKVVHAQVRFVDVPGGLSALGLATLREADALALVLRGFGPDASPAGRAAVPEVPVLERAAAALSEERPLSEAGFAEDDLQHLRALSPLTLKPWIPVANLEEGAESPDGLPDGTVGVWASIEAETAGMPEEEARALLAEFGVEEPGLDRVIAACYRALDLITFLTTGEDETRAWEVRRGATAQEAAGVIHTDLARGFIRAEVVSYDDLVATGSWNEAKARGLLRVEGKDYVVREGDILHVRFNV